MTEFKTDISENGKKFELVFQTDNKAYFEKMQAMARECIDYKPVTQFDRIKTMSVEELAKQLVVKINDGFSFGYYCLPTGNGYLSRKIAEVETKQWLEQEVSE